MDDEKWVWADDEDDFSALPRLDADPAPIIDSSDPSGPQPRSPSTPSETAHPARRQIPQSMLQAIVLHLEGNLEEAIQELETGLRNGDPPADLYTAMGALQMELEHYEGASASY